MFADSAALTEAYLNLKFGEPTKAACNAVARQALAVIEGCKKAKGEIYEYGPKVHGAREFSRLDLLDVWENKACAVYDNALDMASKSLH